MDIQADLVYKNIGYDVTSYFRSAVNEIRKTAENAAWDASGGISPERFERESRYLVTRVSGTVSPTNVHDMTSLAASDRL